jgi:hypothetical protein
MDIDKIKARIETLTNICLKDNEKPPSKESKQACLAFLTNLPTPFDKPDVIVTHEGHLRACWPYIRIEFVNAQEAKCIVQGTFHDLTLLRTLTCLLEANKLFIKGH